LLWRGFGGDGGERKQHYRRDCRQKAKNGACRRWMRPQGRKPSLDAGAGGIEPPNGGIKISLIIQRFQGALEKGQKTPSSNFNSLAAVYK
jgi:hypothetical protein